VEKELEGKMTDTVHLTKEETTSLSDIALREGRNKKY
jgi:hypothetical protein